MSFSRRGVWSSSGSKRPDRVNSTSSYNIPEKTSADPEADSGTIFSSSGSFRTSLSLTSYKRNVEALILNVAWSLPDL